MRKRLSFSRRATADLDQIWNYTERHWGRQQAELYASEIAGRCRALIEGRIVPREISLNNGRFLRLRSGSHLIFLSEMPDQLRVVRILHERQDVETELAEDHSTQSRPISR